MLKRSIIGLAVAGLALTYAPAYADPPETNGLICQFASVIDPTAEPGSQSGQVSGGPVLLTEQSTNPDLPGTTPETGTLSCRVQINDSTHAGSGPSVTGHGTGVLTAGPATINYIAGDTDLVYLCSEFTDDSDGVTYYWNDDTGEWDTNILAPCGLAFGNPPPDPSDDIINRIPCPIFAQLPGPVAQALQGEWGDCVGTGPESIAVAAGVGDTGVLVTSPLWNCGPTPVAVVGQSGSVSCTPVDLLGTPNRCKEVFAAAVALPPPPDVNATISATTTCGTLNTMATASTTGPFIATNSAIDSGATSQPMPVVCSWDNTNGGPTVWAVVCGWNLPFPLGL
jgi:hypothetical protein